MQWETATPVSWEPACLCKDRWSTGHVCCRFRDESPAKWGKCFRTDSLEGCGQVQGRFLVCTGGPCISPEHQLAYTGRGTSTHTHTDSATLTHTRPFHTVMAFTHSNTLSHTRSLTRTRTPEPASPDMSSGSAGPPCNDSQDPHVCGEQQRPHGNWPAQRADEDVSSDGLRSTQPPATRGRRKNRQTPLPCSPRLTWFCNALCLRPLTPRKKRQRLHSSNNRDTAVQDFVTTTPENKESEKGPRNCTSIHGQRQRVKR